MVFDEKWKLAAFCVEDWPMEVPEVELWLLSWVVMPTWTDPTANWFVDACGRLLLWKVVVFAFAHCVDVCALDWLLLSLLITAWFWVSANAGTAALTTIRLAAIRPTGIVLMSKGVVKLLSLKDQNYCLLIKRKISAIIFSSVDLEWQKLLGR